MSFSSLRVEQFGAELALPLIRLKLNLPSIFFRQVVPDFAMALGI